MSEHRDLELLLRSHLAATADRAPSRGQLDAVMGRVAATPQRPAWTGFLTADGRAAMGQAARGQVRLGVLLATLLLLVVLLTIGLLAGRRNELAVEPARNASPPAIALLQSPHPASSNPTTPPTAQPTDGPPCTEFSDLATKLGAAIGVAWGSSTRSPIGAPVHAGKIATWLWNASGTAANVDLVDPATGAQETLVPFGVALPRYRLMSWSPDGSALAIGFTGDCSSGVFVWTPNGVTLLNPGQGVTLDPIAGLDWSPDSTRLTVVPNTATPVGVHTWILPRDGSPKVDLVPPCPTCNGGGPWSPDGLRLGGLYEDVGGAGRGMGVAIVDPLTRRWTLIPEPDGGFTTLGWLTDRTFLTDVTTDGGSEELMTYHEFDAARSLLPVAPRGAFKLLPDRQHVLEQAVQGSNANQRLSLDTLDLDIGTRRTVWTAPRGIQLGGGILAPDGSAIVMDGGRGSATQLDTWVIRLDGSGATKLSGIDISDGAWQPIAP